MKNRSQLFGKLGEILAVKYLKKNKYKIISVNYLTDKGEIDIVAKTKSIFVFVEVKTRRNREFSLPQFAVNKEKQEHIRNSAFVFLRQNKIYDTNFRFDIIEVVGEDVDNLEINHIENAFS